MDRRNWKTAFLQAAFLFSIGEHKSALLQLESLEDDLRSLTAEERLDALGSIGHLLKMNNRIVEATRYFEGLVALARQLEPTSIKTARDLVHLSQLYSKVDWTDKQHATLSQGVDIYYNLTPDDEKLLLPMERASATVELETLSGMLADRADSPGEASGKGDVLRKLLQPLEREVSRIEMFPEIVPQQIYNDHLASYESDCLREARNRFLDHRFSLKWWGIIRRFLRGLPRSLMNTSFEE